MKYLIAALLLFGLALMKTIYKIHLKYISNPEEFKVSQ
jgi:hypothetical protein